MNEIDNRLLGKTFLWMFIGLLVSGVVAWVTYTSGAFISLISGGSFYALLFLEIAVVIIFDLIFKKISPTAVGILYFLYAILNGLTLSFIFYAYELNSILYIFFATSLVFGILAYAGLHTEKDLSNWGSYIFAFLIAGMILSLINIFFHNPMFDMAVDWIILGVFCGVVIYDVNTMNRLLTNVDANPESMSIYCAMQIYLDFVNIFLRLLSLFGKSRD
jgi:FtsH-binding integral membrane protein